MSQEALAELLSVSRQSVSKWEVGDAIPGLDKIRSIAAIFNVTFDELLSEDAAFSQRKPYPVLNYEGTGGNKYFGTDGFRGEANVTLTSKQAYLVGRFLGWFFSRGALGAKRARIVIGKDTRRSSYMLEYSIIAGICASGADAYMLHVITTPGVSYITKIDGFCCGVMITASHNPYQDNGIKIIGRSGEKLCPRDEALAEAYIDGDMQKLCARGDILQGEGGVLGSSSCSLLFLNGLESSFGRRIVCELLVFANAAPVELAANIAAALVGFFMVRARFG